jgi:hypothetical protein
MGSESPEPSSVEQSGQQPSVTSLNSIEVTPTPGGITNTTTIASAGNVSDLLSGLNYNISQVNTSNNNYNQVIS